MMWVYLLIYAIWLIVEIRLPIFNIYVKIHQTNLVTGVSTLKSSDIFFYMGSIEGKWKKKKNLYMPMFLL